MIDEKLQDQVAEIVKADVPSRHTFFQLNFFVLGKEPTHQARLKRCVDELRSRKHSMDGLLAEIEDLKDRNQLIYWEMGHMKFVDDEERDIRCRMAERKIGANNRAIDELGQKIKSNEEEMIFFVEAFNRLSEIEPLKQWDDAEVQTQYWNAKLSEEVNHRLLMQMPIDMEIIKTVLALPAEASVKKQVLAILHRQTEKILPVGTNSVVA